MMNLHDAIQLQYEITLDPITKDQLSQMIESVDIELDTNRRGRLRLRRADNQIQVIEMVRVPLLRHYLISLGRLEAGSQFDWNEEDLIILIDPRLIGEDEPLLTKMFETVRRMISHVLGKSS